jgi:hypothetical protein
MQNRIVGVIAPKGSGKTYMVTEAMRGMERVAAFDMLHEGAYLGVADEMHTGAPAAFAESLRADQFRVIYRPTIFSMQDEEEYCPEFEPFVTLCYLRGDMTMIIDEAHQICTARTCPDMLRNAVRLGRHRQLNIYFVTQSFSAVARPLTENADEFWFWKIIEPKDIEGIRARCGLEVAHRVLNLRRLEMNGQGKVIPGEMVRWTTYGGLE